VVSLRLYTYPTVDTKANHSLACAFSNSAAEANASLAQLHAAVAELLESHHKMDMKLGELIARRSQTDAAGDITPPADTVAEPASLELSAPNSSDIAHASPTGAEPCDPDTRDNAEASSLASSSPSTVTTTTEDYWSGRGRDSDASTFMSARSSFSVRSMRSIRSVRSVMPSFQEFLKNSRAYKRLYRRGGLDDSQSISGLSLESSPKRGNWSMLSDMSLGDLSISDIAVMELPIYVTDLYDPGPYLLTPIPATGGSSKSSDLRWSSRGRIHNAISSGNLFAVRALLSIGADIEEGDRKGQTPLLHAVRREYEEIVKLLLKKGANPNARDSDGNTPLALAVLRDARAIVNLLLEKGADTKVEDAEARTPLVLAVLQNHEAIVELLLEKGADTEVKDTEARTPLELAVLQNHEAIVELLLAKGAKIDALGDVVSERDRMRIHASIEAGNKNVVCLLLVMGGDVEERDNSGRTPLAHAVDRDREDIVRLLLEKGADPEVKDLLGRTPLALATQESIVRLLLEKGVNLDAPGIDGHTPLSLAVTHGHEAIVNLLVENGANIDVLSGTGSKSDLRGRIHEAIERGKENIVRLLLVMGVDVEERDEKGLTPLAHAVLENNDRFVELLLEKGANVDILSDIGSKRDLKGRIHDAIERGNSNVVRLLLVMGVDVEEPGFDGMTPLLNACWHGESEIAKMLVAQGADVKACDKYGQTVLHWTVESKDASLLLTFLLDNGALELIDATDNDGDTPLHRAGTWDSQLPVAKILVERGARLDLENKKGLTPYEYALSEGSGQVANYLRCQLSPNKRAQLQPPPSD
jgi:ankyrin repeat protein